MPIFKGFLDKRIEVLDLLKEKPSNKNQICLHSSMGYSTILVIFKDLLANKLVERINLEIDTRQHKFKITDNGLQLLKLLE